MTFEDQNPWAYLNLSSTYIMKLGSDTIIKHLNRAVLLRIVQVEAMLEDIVFVLND